MKYCPKCKCGGRIRGVAEKDDGSHAEYICPNPVCSNFRCVFADEVFPKKTDMLPRQPAHTAAVVPQI